ncbi:hypothetical protein DY000_02013656 [Brassica cretica]|uniref:Uncharacterized protein n=1 Tax=Brassica cretica TaxID=69181 RepID=A0ABQ7CWS4_BRACR|nr:hypothetical protein DY000_02013656 [Brassica cretica]
MFDSSKLRRIRDVVPLATVLLLLPPLHRSFRYSRLLTLLAGLQNKNVASWPLPPKANRVYSSWGVEVLRFLGAPVPSQPGPRGQSLSGSVSAPLRKAICAGGR